MAATWTYAKRGCLHTSMCVRACTMGTVGTKSYIKKEKSYSVTLKRRVLMCNCPGCRVAYLWGATWLWLLRGVPPSPSARLCTELHTRLTPISSTTATIHHNTTSHHTTETLPYIAELHTRLTPISSTAATIHHIATSHRTTLAVHYITSPSYTPE